MHGILCVQGTQTEGRLAQDAVLQMDVSAGSLLGGSSSAGPFLFSSVREAEREAPGCLALSANKATDLYIANARLQNMMGQVDPLPARYSALEDCSQENPSCCTVYSRLIESRTPQRVCWSSCHCNGV